MQKHFNRLFLFVAVYSMPIMAQVITFQSRLEEVTDRIAIASFPSTGYRCLQASSYNRASVPPPGSEGWFADSDGIGFIREEKQARRHEWVVMEHKGPGCVTRMWTPFFYYDLNDRRGPKIRIYLDDAEVPVIEDYFIELLTRGDFPGAPEKKNTLEVPFPFAAYTARAGDLYLPIPFAKSCKITMDKKPFYYVINYRAYPEDTPVETWSNKLFADAHEVFGTVADTLLNIPACTEGAESSINRTIAAGEEAILDLPPGSNAVCHLELLLAPQENNQYLRSTILCMVVDGEETVWTPVGDFFCSGNQLNPFKTWEREVSSNGAMVCRWIMPYGESAKVSLRNLGTRTVDAVLRVRTTPWKWTEASMHFHARWRMDKPVPGTPFQDWNFVDILGKGVYVGDAWTVLCSNTGWWGEGDEKIYIDKDYEEKRFPSHFGTGTEDYYGWAGGEVPTGADVFSMPFLSNVRVGNSANPRGYNICTRSRVLDAIPFTTRLRFDMEASFGVQMRNPWDLLQYSVITFWYALPGVTHNCPPQPEWAVKAAMTVEDLDACEAQLRAAFPGKWMFPLQMPICNG